MDMIKAMIYGIVEGITEWLPVSSTGHMILLERLLPFQGVGEDFFNVFDVVIQLGAIMAVVGILFDDRCFRGDGCIYGIHHGAPVFYQLCEKT